MYQIIIYELVLFKVKQNNREIKKRYFKRIASYKNIKYENICNKAIELKKTLYKDSKYILSFIKNDDTDDFYINLNKKSEKDYIQYIKGE